MDQWIVLLVVQGATPVVPVYGTCNMQAQARAQEDGSLPCLHVQLEKITWAPGQPGHGTYLPLPRYNTWEYVPGYGILPDTYLGRYLPRCSTAPYDVLLVHDSFLLLLASIPPRLAQTIYQYPEY